MIPKLNHIIHNIESLPIAMPRIFVTAIDRNKEYAADLITEQMTKGLDGTGEAITPEYLSDEYAIYKRSIGSISGFNPDLKLSGRYHRSIEIKVSGMDAVVTSSDPKDEKLTAKYGQQIKQFNQESKSDLMAQILPDIKELAFQHMLIGV